MTALSILSRVHELHGIKLNTLDTAQVIKVLGVIDITLFF